MAATSATLTAALRALAGANEAPGREGPGLGAWRWTMRQRIAAVRDALLEELPPGRDDDDGWLAARGGTAFRERNALLMRLGTLATRVLEDPDVNAVRAEVARLVVDVTHHVQRLHDLAYDAVELELGGSE
ncbi:hypothetical protein [Nocardioides rubriscoriae]|uniref:hypothetical protein n=1 Tax=Nocardioides rubriscoriae TaxID=642762 RepID=UPI0011E03600|nr:hypothetical protein [Nocardioides rubriscoriae]